MTYEEHVDANEKELKEFLKRNYPKYDMYPAERGEIFVGFLRQADDYTWNRVKTYYWNTNNDLTIESVRDTKI